MVGRQDGRTAGRCDGGMVMVVHKKNKRAILSHVTQDGARTKSYGIKVLNQRDPYTLAKIAERC